MKRAAVWLATAGGAGYVPVAPGTAGSLVGVIIYWLTRSWAWPWQVGLLLAIIILGTRASSIASEHFGRKDPSHVVIDEVAGQMLTLLATGADWRGMVLGFAAFRLFDIVKPWPARNLERLPAGTGIMADDLMAGVYGNAVLQVTRALLGSW